VSTTKVSHAVTSRYALALIELAAESDKTGKIEQDLIDFSSMIASSPDLSRAIHSPSLSRDRQHSAIDAIAAKAGFDALTRKFLGVLVNNRRLNAVQPIIEAIRAELSRRRGEVAVTVQTAQAMSAAQMEALRRAISKSLGHEIALKAKVEPGILGGLIVTVGSRMVDDSVARKLERLKAAMSRQSNQNFNDNLKEVK
jgi:F-type H+-transporting ATPase subunit delta